MYYCVNNDIGISKVKKPSDVLSLILFAFSLNIKSGASNQGSLTSGKCLCPKRYVCNFHVLNAVFGVYAFKCCFWCLCL